LLIYNDVAVHNLDNIGFWKECGSQMLEILHPTL